MSRRRTINNGQQSGPHIQLELSLRSEVSAISPFVDTFMRLIRKCKWVPGSEKDVETALQEALANAVVHGNHEDREKKVYIGCRGGTDEISIVIRTAMRNSGAHLLDFFQQGWPSSKTGYSRDSTHNGPLISCGLLVVNRRSQPITASFSHS